MLQKILPRNGKVVIIDNKREEVEQLEDLLTQNGASYIFYDYNKLRDTDIKKCSGIRLMFLDIRLEEGTSDPKTLCTILASAIDKVVEKENGPYTIVLWTNEISLKEQVEEFLLERLSSDETTAPSCVCALDKKDFISEPETKLIEKLYEQLKEQHMMSFLFEWENNAMFISHKTIQLLLYGMSPKLSNAELETLFARIACLDYAGDTESATKNLVNVLSELMKDRYMEVFSEKELIKSLSDYWKVDFTKIDETEQVEVSLKAKLNTSLNLNIYDKGNEGLPGKVYAVKKEDLHLEYDKFEESTLSKNWPNDNIFKFKGGKEASVTYTPIEVDVTPHCDYAQGKNHMLRTLFGYKVTIEKNECEGELIWLNGNYMKKIKDTISFPYVYVTPEFIINDELCVFILNTKYLTIEPHGYEDKHQYLFRFNSEILNEIRKTGAETLSRIGINNL